MPPLLRRLFSTSARSLRAFSRAISWKPTGRPQRTLARPVARSGTALHSGGSTTARLLPAAAGEGRYFVLTASGTAIPATVAHAIHSPLCTTLRAGGGGARVRTVEHLLSALEACGVDNCRIEIDGGDEVPLLDGSAVQWVDAVEQVGLCIAVDYNGFGHEKFAPELHEPVHLWQGDAFIIALPSTQVHLTYGIDFPKAPAIGCQWFSCLMDTSLYSEEIAPSRTFCIYEEVEVMCQSGLIKGGSADNAIVCSTTDGWLNPPLRFPDEPCRHKVLDLIGDFSLFAQNGNQGLPLAHIIAYKAGHSLHTDFVRLLSRLSQLKDVSHPNISALKLHGL